MSAYLTQDYQLQRKMVTGSVAQMTRCFCHMRETLGSRLLRPTGTYRQSQHLGGGTRWIRNSVRWQVQDQPAIHETLSQKNKSIS